MLTRMVVRVVMIVTVMIWSAALVQVLDQEPWTKQDQMLFYQQHRNNNSQSKYQSIIQNISCMHIFCIYLLFDLVTAAELESSPRAF